MKFEYQAIDEDGALVRGIIKASTPEKVLQILLHKQLHPLDIRVLTESTIELSRLHNLKQRLQSKNLKKEDPKPELKPIKELKEKSQVDWTYISFIILVVGILTSAILTG